MFRLPEFFEDIPPLLNLSTAIPLIPLKFDFTQARV